MRLKKLRSRDKSIKYFEKKRAQSFKDERKTRKVIFLSGNRNEIKKRWTSGWKNLICLCGGTRPIRIRANFRRTTTFIARWVGDHLFSGNRPVLIANDSRVTVPTLSVF